MLRLAQQAGNLTGREIVGLPCKAGREAGLLAEFFLQGRLRVWRRWTSGWMPIETAPAGLALESGRRGEEQAHCESRLALRSLGPMRISGVVWNNSALHAPLLAFRSALDGWVESAIPLSFFRPGSQQPAHIHELSQMICVVIGYQQGFSQNGLTFSPRDARM
jgi:hypothetical protein